MAVYWIDPHTTTNGAGTFASPYSANSTTRAALVSGDEYRIKGVPLTSLLTATVYTATYTSYYQLTITAGGGLGADFAAFDVIYLPDAGTFVKIATVSGNVIALSTTGMLPWYNTSTGQTAITVRRVNLAAYPVSAVVATMTLANNTSTPNITISDCWTDAVTRVTDGTVKTLLNTSSTAASSTLNIDGSIGSSPPTSTNRVYSLENTHVLGGSSAAAGSLSVRINASYVTATLGQAAGNAYSSTFSGIGIGAASSPSYSVDLTVTHATSISLVGSQSFASSVNITATNVAISPIDNVISAVLTLGNVRNYTINLNTAVFNSSTNAVSFLGQNSSIIDSTINLNGPFELYSNTALTAIAFTAYGTYTINYGPSFIFRYNRRAVTQTTINTLFNGSNTWLASAGEGPFLFVPTITAPPGWTATNGYSLGSPANAGIIQTTPNSPIQTIFSLPIPTATAGSAFGSSKLVNTLVIHRDGSAPYEILGLNAVSNASAGITYTQLPVVTTDAAVFRTTGPSLRANLQTRSATLWTTATAPRPKKSIKIPVTAGVAVTVSGYIRTSQAAYTNGDVVMRLMFNETTLGSQSMTTACINAWEGFSITATPTFTGEALLLWEMYYSAAGNYWLDDLTVT